MRSIKWFTVAVFLALVVRTSAQDIPWRAEYENLNLTELVSRIEDQYPVKFFFNTDSIGEIRLTGVHTGDFFTVLNSLLVSHDLNAYRDEDNNVFITKKTKSLKSLNASVFSQSGNAASAIPANGRNHTNGYMQSSGSIAEERVQVGRLVNDNKSRATLSGYVRSSEDNSPLIGVMIRVDGTNNAVLSDVSGFYSLNIEKGDRIIIAGNLETREKRFNLRMLSDGRMDILLEPRLVTLNAVVISADKEQIVRSTQMGYQRLATKEIKEIPVVLGEQDLIKVSLLLPGIQTVGEGSSGVNVRGSPTDQNLFIINNIPVYNSSHLLGFFSAFNSDAIKDFELYKSNMPANMGGRLSSIFDIRTRQGNQKNFTLQGGISPVTARITLEGPLQKGKSSYLVAARTTYSDWILAQIDDPDISKSKAGFADAIINLAFELNSNNRMSFTTYHSNDRVNIIEENRYRYGNTGASLNWSHLFREKNNLALSLIYSRYQFDEKNSESVVSSYSDYFSLQHAELKAGYTMRPWENHILSAGLNSILYVADQGNFKPLSDASKLIPMDLGNEKALESAIYLSDEWTPLSKLTFTATVRFTNYMYLGPRSVKVYDPDRTRSAESILDTVNYGNNEVISSKQSPDLRFSARYLILPNLSLKLSYSQMQQYIFMLTNTIAVAPTDKWKLSDNFIKPMAGRQYSAGIYGTLFQGKLDVTAEGYYKEISNLVDYKNGANLVVNELPETDIIQGDLTAYGLEFMINKPKGRFNGWMSYTWARTLENVEGRFKEEKINNGRQFPSNYDKPHALNVVANYKFSRRFSVSSNVVYSTGRPVTFPVGFYNHDLIRVPLYSNRNEFRIPDYFRIDLSVKVEGNLASRKFAHGMWILSVYNVTSRKNAYSVFYRYEDGTMKGYKMTVFGVPVVSLTYSFKLGNYAN